MSDNTSQAAMGKEVATDESFFLDQTATKELQITQNSKAKNAQEPNTGTVSVDRCNNCFYQRQSISRDERWWAD